MITAEIIADSTHEEGPDGFTPRLTTFLLTYPRFIHAEFATHRLFSRNASSSRAIPVITLLLQVLFNPAIPVYWGQNQKGMQARTELSGLRLRLARFLYLGARFPVALIVYILTKLGLHKQLANRLLEPWGHITVVVSSTDYANFFALRSHPDAQPEIRVLSDLMREAYARSVPRRLAIGEWHLPFLKAHEHALDNEVKLALSVARCARTSYLTHSKENPSVSADQKLHDMLVNATPPHMSPFEHQALPDWWNPIKKNWEAPERHGNFTGFQQYRKFIANEAVRG